MLRSLLFWKFFISILLVVLLTSIASVQFERYVREHASEQRLSETIERLVGFRAKLSESLAEDEIDEVVEQLNEHPKFRRQFLIFDEAGHEILGRKRNKHSRFKSKFSRTLQREFRERGLPLKTTIYSDNGQKYQIKIQPIMLFDPWVSPRTAGGLMRLFLLLSLSGLVCYFLTRALIKRIKTLQLATKRLATGHFNEAFPDNIQFSRDELGQLGKDFQLMANQLHDSQQARKQILSDISHELRSPLARMQVALEITRNRFPDAENQLHRIEKESNRMNALIGQILHLQRLQMNNKTQHEAESISLTGILTDVIADAEYEYQQSNKSIEFQQTEAFTILGNSEALYSAFENIIRNALSHAKQRVTVTVTPTPRMLQINIVDDGEGINPKDTEKIFRPFVRLDSSRNRQTGGHGLGLAIAKAVIEKHSGTITAENRYENHAVKGLLITIHLPRHSEN